MDIVQQVLQVQTKYQKINREATWCLKDVGQSIYDPQVAVTDVIGEIVEKQNFQRAF